MDRVNGTCWFALRKKTEMTLGKILRALIGVSAALFVATAQADAVATLKRFLSETTRFSSGFSLSVWSESRRKTTHSNGQLALQKPGKFRWEVDQPYPQLIVGNGEKVWIYDPDLKQVSIRKMEQALGTSPVALLTETEEELLKHFELREAEKEEGLEWIEATPKTQESGIFRILMGFTEKGEPKTMRFFDNFGQITTIRFHNPKKNAKIPEHQFQFTPAEGVEVYE